MARIKGSKNKPKAIVKDLSKVETLELGDVLCSESRSELIVVGICGYTLLCVATRWNSSREERPSPACHLLSQLVEWGYKVSEAKAYPTSKVAELLGSKESDIRIF